MDPQAAEFLTAYDQHRVRDQLAFYKKRQVEYERTSRQIETIVELSLALAAIAGASTFLIPLEWGKVAGAAAAIFGAIAAALTAWADVVGFKASAKLYRAARRGIERLRPNRPQWEKARPQDIDTYVINMEEILLGEVRTWGEKWSRAGAATPSIDMPDIMRAPIDNSPTLVDDLKGSTKPTSVPHGASSPIPHGASSPIPHGASSPIPHGASSPIKPGGGRHTGPGEDVDPNAGPDEDGAYG